VTDDRSERLRKRRKQSTQRAEGGQDSETATSGAEPSSPDSAAHDPTDGDAVTDDADEDGEETNSIKENQVGTYMYLPESQTKNLRRLYNVLKAEYEYKYDEEFQKNRHFYPLVIKYGLDGLDGLDASEIQARLHEIR
jgi:hypothetical protein